MSEKPAGKGRGRPNIGPDEPKPPPPPKEYVDELLKSAENGSGEGTVTGCSFCHLLGCDHDIVIKTKMM